MLCINTFGRVRYFPDQAKKKIQNGCTSTLNEITNAEFLRTDHGYFNRPPIDHNDRLKPVLTTGLVNTPIDRSIANPVGGTQAGEGSRGPPRPLVGPGQIPGRGFRGRSPRRKTIFSVLEWL